MERNEVTVYSGLIDFGFWNLRQVCILVGCNTMILFKEYRFKPDAINVPQIPLDLAARVHAL